MSSLEDRESETQTRSREDNESTARVSAGGAPMISFRCECGDEACTCSISLTPAEYEHVRGYATHFAIAENHENPESEQLIEEHGRFDVVESIAHDAVKLARRRNPRPGEASSMDRSRLERTAPAETVRSIPIRERGWRRSVPVDGAKLLNVHWHELGDGPSPRSCPICDARVRADDDSIHHGGERYHGDCARLRLERA